MNVTTTSNSQTYYFEDIERVYPCRCGVTHRGDYAVYDYGHHNCFHPEWMFLDSEIPRVLICVHCGETSRLVD